MFSKLLSSVFGKSFALVLLLSGCTNFDRWSYDAPHIRELQRASLARVSARPIKGESMEDFFRDKVGLIVPEKRRFPSGRAVPISRDGYFLTAWHVVDEGEFSLSNFVQLKSLPEGKVVKASEYYRDDLHSGRVVWKDAQSDLAIVKFEFKPEHVFDLTRRQVQVGTEVFSAAVGTNSGLLMISENANLNSGVGNGPYQTAGAVTKSMRRRGFAYHYESTLVARGGMSGGAVVDSGGSLVGVLTQIRSGLLSTPKTSFAMLDAREIQRIVSQDRASTLLRITFCDALGSQNRERGLSKPPPRTAES